MTIADKLASLKSDNRKALAMFSTIGDPDLTTSLRAFTAMGASGADILELGIPYSDPLMDGPVLQRSYQRALNRGFRLRELPSFIESLRRKTEAPALIMTCFNPIHRYGVNRFFNDVSSAGADSVLITDLPPEEWGESIDLARSYKLGTIFLIAPTTTIPRMELINNISDPFVYCITRTGVTGTADELPDSLKSLAAFVGDVITKPLMLGFGISNARQARLASRLADGVIIGSALVQVIEQHIDNKEAILKNIDGFVSGVRAAIDSAE